MLTQYKSNTVSVCIALILNRTVIASLTVGELFCSFSSLLLLFLCYLCLAEISAVRRVEKSCVASLNALAVSGCVFLSLMRCTQGPAGSSEQLVQLDSRRKQKNKTKKQACISSVHIFTHGLT